MKLRPGWLSFSVQRFLDSSQLSPRAMSVKGLHELRSSALPGHKLLWTKAGGASAASVAVFASSAKPQAESVEKGCDPRELRLAGGSTPAVSRGLMQAGTSYPTGIKT